nr:hypothetical protein [Tanacetum cinerariifolium]
MQSYVLCLLCAGERKPRKGQNQIKTGQKWEAWRSPEKSKAISVKKEKLKKIQVKGAKCANSTKFYYSKKSKGLKLKFNQRSKKGTKAANRFKLYEEGTNYRSNPRYTIKECSSCGTLYTRDRGCSKGNVEDKIRVPKPPKNCAWCTRCGYLVDGPNCQGCALLRQELEENLVTHSPDFQNSAEPSNASTNVVNGSFVDKIIFDLNIALDSPNQFHCFHCKDVLRDGEACKRCTCAKCGSDGIFCKRYTCKFCGKDAHIGYNCPSKVLVISNPEPCNNQTIDELPQTLPSFHPTFHSEAESPFTLDSTPTYVDESPNIFNPPPQPFVYPCEFCGNDAYFCHYCTPQAPFIYPEPCYNQDFNFPQDFENVP